jgi:FKBP-type peptidyl-prolyl cis-trans isomerase (trigger factor)
MNIMVFHAKNPTFTQVTKLPSIPELEKDYSYVGSFEINGSFSVDETLEAVFEKTQNVFESWSPNNHRSSSVGDLMVVDYETTYSVSPIGFSKLN